MSDPRKRKRPIGPGQRNRRLVKMFKTQKGRCYICDCVMTLRRDRPNTATREHVIPQSAGGKNNHKNLKAACHDCNQRKRSDWDGNFDYTRQRISRARRDCREVLREAA